MLPDSPLKFWLPPELWLYTFRIATTLNPLYETKYLPFEDLSRIHAMRDSQDGNLVLGTKMSLLLVCRQWKEIVLECMYENIHIGDHWQSLLNCLEGSKLKTDGIGYGQSVRCISLRACPVETDKSKLEEIIKQCSNAEILIKEDDDTMVNPTFKIRLNSLRRFDWSYYYRGLRNPRNFSQCRDLFKAIVSQASNLVYLSIGIYFFTSRIHDYPPILLTLDHLTVLRVEGIEPRLRKELEGWSFPKLTHITFDVSLTWPTISPLFSPQIEVIEFLQERHSVSEAFSALNVVKNCPNLRGLNFHIDFSLFTLHPGLAPNLPCVHLHSGRRIHRLNHYSATDSWSTYQLFFERLGTQELFPSIKNLFLHGDWSFVNTDARFERMIQTLACQGCQVSYVDDCCIVPDKY